MRWSGSTPTRVTVLVCRLIATSCDMWQPYLKVVAKKADHALHVLDRFHIALNMNTAIDTVRRAEVRELKQQLQAKIGELLMENELLYAKVDRLEASGPLARRRSMR